MALIVQDSINGQPVYLTFSDNSSIREGEPEPRIQQLLQSSDDEQAYLEGVFREGKTETKFLASTRRQQLLVPVRAGGRTVVVVRFTVDEW